MKATKNINEKANSVANIENPEIKEVKKVTSKVTKKSEPKAEVKKTTTHQKEEKAVKKVKLVNKKAVAKEEAVKEVKKQAKANLVEEVVTKREVKYIYPEDCQDTLSRKKHRQQVRNKLNQLELEMYRIKDKQSKEYKAKEQEYLKFKKENLKAS